MLGKTDGLERDVGNSWVYSIFYRGNWNYFFKHVFTDVYNGPYYDIWVVCSIFEESTFLAYNILLYSRYFSPFLDRLIYFFLFSIFI